MIMIAQLSFVGHFQVKIKLHCRYPDLKFEGEEDAYLKSLLAKAEQPNDKDDEDDDVANIVHMYRERNKALRERSNNNTGTSDSTAAEGKVSGDSGPS